MVSRDEVLAQIAKKHCRLDTLETQGSDRLDFHEVSVWGLKAALEDAFKAGAAHQLAQEKASNQSLAEPPESNERSQAEELLSRLEQNFADMMNDLRSDITAPLLPTQEIVSLADRITAVSAAYDYLTDHDLPADQVGYLLNFAVPLEVVADRWPGNFNNSEEASRVLWDICDRQDALQGDYPLMADVPDTPAPKPEPQQQQPSSGKPSLLAGLREAKERAAIENAHNKEKNAPKHTGPEL